MNSLTRVVQTPFGRLIVEARSAHVLDAGVIASAAYGRALRDSGFRLSLGTRPVSGRSANYRNAAFAKGLHVGHHLGPPGAVEVSEDAIAVELGDGKDVEYTRVMWNYALKIYFTIQCAAVDAAHLKAATVAGPGGDFRLLVGRGGGGKTTLAKFLESNGWIIAGNTHAFVKDAHAWAANTWIRTRNSHGEQMTAALDSTRPADGALRTVFIVEHNDQRRLTCDLLRPAAVESFFDLFVSATGAYDLKEDLADLWGSFPDSSAALARERLAVRQVLLHTPIRYLSADLDDAACRAEVLRIFREP